MTEEPISEYDEGKIPEQKAKNILESPEDNEDYFPCPYKYIFKDGKNSKTDHVIDRETFDDLQKEVKHPEVLVKELKTQQELEEEIMQDSSVYNDEWDFFLEDLSGIMESKNGENDWETPCDALEKYIAVHVLIEIKSNNEEYSTIIDINQNTDG